MSHDAIRELLAAYALDAVDADEAETIDLHLRGCPRCRAEVVEFREAASALATGHDTAPVRLWDNIVAELEASPPMELAPVVPLRPSPARRIGRVAVAAAAAAVVAVLGLRVTQQDDRIERMQVALEDRTVLAAALAASNNPDARRTELLSKDGVVVARAVLVPDGTGYLWSEALPDANPDRTYQLWAVIGTERISAGVLGPSPEVTPFRIAGDVVALAITEEAAGGVVASENQPIASGLLAEA